MPDIITAGRLALPRTILAIQCIVRVSSKLRFVSSVLWCGRFPFDLNRTSTSCRPHLPSTCRDRRLSHNTTGCLYSRCRYLAGCR